MFVKLKDNFIPVSDKLLEQGLAITEDDKLGTGMEIFEDKASELDP